MQKLEKVISLRRVPHVTEGKVPSWNDFMGARKEFEAAIAQVWEKIKYIDDNKQAIWDILDQLKEAPPHGTNTNYQREVRKIYEDIRELERNVWREEGGRTPLWNFAGGLRARIDALESRLGTLPDVLRATVREAIHAELDPLLGSAAANIGAVLEDNRKLKEEIAALRAEVEALKTRLNT